MPSSPASACHCRSVPQAICTGASAVRNRPYGAIDGVVVAGRVRHLVGDGPAGALVGVHADDGREQRGAHHPAAPGQRPLVQRGEHAVGAVHPGEQVADRDAHAGRLVGRRTGQRHQPGLALGDLVVARAAALGPVVPEPGDREDDQPRVDLVQPLVREAEPVQHAGAEVLHQHVGAGHQPGQELPALLGLQVGGHRLLVAVRREEVRRHGVVLRADEGRPPGAGVVAGGGLHLDHPRAEVGEHHRGVRTRERTGEVDDDQVGGYDS